MARGPVLKARPAEPLAMMHLPRSALNRGDGLSDRHQRGNLKDNWPGLVKKVTCLFEFAVKFEIAGWDRSDLR